MANYSNDFNALTVGSGVPAGFTSRWDAGTWAVQDASGDKYVRESSAAGNRYFISMDAIDGDANRDNVEVLMRVRLSSIATPSQTYLGAILRGSGNGSSETGYGILVVTGSPNLRITKYSAGTNTPLATSASPITFNANSIYLIRARVNGTSLKGRVWADGASENTSFWDVEWTDSSISGAGWAGFFGFIGGVNKDIFDIAIATNGDTASFSAPSSTLAASGAAQAAGSGQLAAAVAMAAAGADVASGTASLSGGAAGDVAAAGGAVADGQGDLKVQVDLQAAGSAQAGGSAAGEALTNISISAAYERSSVNVAGSSVTGAGDAAVIVIKPRVQESEVKGSLTAWLEPSAKIIGVNGIRPTFRFSDYAATWSDGTYHGVPWGASRRPMFSYDRQTWTYFDTQTIGASYIEFRHNTAFTADSVYISRERQVSVTQTGEWIEAMAAAHPTLVTAPASALAFTPTLTSWPAQAFIAAEFSPQTNELGEAIPATPFYALEINDPSLMPDYGTKQIAVMTAGVHAGEDTGNWAMMRAVERLLGSSTAAQYVRRNFRVLVYPMINAPGRYGGGWRGSYTQGAGGADDANRHFPESGSGLEIVDKPKAAMHTDRGGVEPIWVVDWHGQFEAPWGYFSDTNALISFASVLSAAFGTTVSDMGDLADNGLTEYWRINQGVAMAITLEFGNNVPVTDAKYEEFGTAFVTSLETYFKFIFADGAAQASGSAALQAQIGLAGVGVAVATGTGVPSVSIPLAATGISIAAGSADSAASVTLTAAGLAVAAAAAGLSADVLISGAGAAQASGNAALAALLTALASGSAQASGGANLTGGAPGSLAASGSAVASGQAALVVTVSLAASGSAQASGSANESANDPSAINAGGGAEASGSATPSVTAMITAAGFVQAMGQGQLAIQVNLAALGAAITSGTAGLSTGATLTINPLYIVRAQARRTRVVGGARNTTISRRPS